MNGILLQGFAEGMDFVAQEAVTALPANPGFLAVGIILVIVTLFLIFFLKKIIVNSILGAIIWAITIFYFKVSLPLIPSFVVSVLFGPAGIGVMYVLKFFGVLVV